MPQEIAFATPRTEELTEVGIAGAGAIITGGVEGVILDMSPQMGALEPVFTWGALLGIPAVGVAGALFTRGMLKNLFTGVACGGLGALGLKLPDLLAAGIPGLAGRRTLVNSRVKQLPVGSAATASAQRAQTRAASVLEI